MNSVPGSEQDLGERFYDARLGKMLSVDPLTGNYAGQSPYAYCGNSPTSSVDVNGAGDTPSGELERRNSIMNLRIGGITSSGNGVNMLAGGNESNSGEFSQGHKGYYGANTPKGRITADYTPIKFKPIGGNEAFTDQNDLTAVNHFIRNRHYDPSEPSSFSSILYTYKSYNFFPGFTLNQSYGISLTRKKGGIYVEGGAWNGEPHFGHGAATFGGAYKWEVSYVYPYRAGFGFSVSSELAAGVLLSDFGPDYPEGFIHLPGKNYPTWSAHGFGATSVNEMDLTFTSKLWNPSSREIIQFNAGILFAVHAMTLAPFNSPRTGIFSGGQGTLFPINLTLSYDLYDDGKKLHPYYR
jgi:hypothetical protein